MTVSVRISDASGTGVKTTVTKYGQLVTSPIEYSTFYPVTLSTINTGFNIVPPKFPFRFVITMITVTTNKEVDVNDAAIEIYEAVDPTTTVVKKSLFKTELIKKSTIVIPNVNVITSEARWINIKTNAKTVFANVAGYYLREPDPDIGAT